MWWPADAPNCFKKEISKITSNKTDISGNATMKILPNIKAATTTLDGVLLQEEGQGSQDTGQGKIHIDRFGG